ncbi:uncharacterized protein LOC126088365 [Schistocerca cancellata]|uniref:uncharacterized protein LOC126088365 n=1 Tax=Schistocerca cancellata TaxID=274614 RepID=UPI0021173499|nr:uncharacterized protein LOC126088365 [Schistocerca cancellata]
MLTSVFRHNFLLVCVFPHLPEGPALEAAVSAAPSFVTGAGWPRAVALFTGAAAALALLHTQLARKGAAEPGTEQPEDSHEVRDDTCVGAHAGGCSPLRPRGKRLRPDGCRRGHKVQPVPAQEETVAQEEAAAARLMSQHTPARPGHNSSQRSITNTAPAIYLHLLLNGDILTLQ